LFSSSLQICVILIFQIKLVIKMYLFVFSFQTKPSNNNMSPPGTGGGTSLHHSASNASLSSYNSATWERTLRGSSSNLVPPPLGSAPPPSTSTLSPYNNYNNNHSNQRVHASMSNLEHSNPMSNQGEISLINSRLHNSEKFSFIL
jgi:hypothetical protein